MVALFRNTSFTSVFLLVILALLVHAHFFVTPAQVVAGNDGLLSFFLKEYIQNLPSIFLWLFYVGILLLQAIRLNHALNENKMFQQSSFSAAMAYILVSGFIMQWCFITSAFIANTFIIWIFVMLCKLYNNASPKTLLYNTGLIVGVTVIGYHPSAILILVVLFALAIVRPFRVAEWLVLLMGILTPFYVLFSFLFLTDKLKTIAQFLPQVSIGLPHFQNEPWLWFAGGTLLVSLLAGLYFYSGASNRMVIQIRKNWSVMLVMLLVMLPISFIFHNSVMYSITMLIIPLSAFIANVYLYPKRLFFPNLLFALALAAIIHNNWVLGKI